MDGYAVATGDEAHDLVAGDGGAALGKLHQAVVQSLHDDALLAVDPAGLGGGLGLVGLLRLGGGVLVLLEDVVDLLPQAAHQLQGGDAAVADGGVHVVQGVVAELFQHQRQILLVGQLLDGDAAAADLRVKGGLAVDDVLVPALLLEPLADLAAGVAGLGNLDPVPAGPVGGFGGLHLHHVAVLQLVVELDDASVDLGGHHVVAHGGVDGIGEVDGRGAGGQVDHVAHGGEHEHLVGEHIHLQGVDEVLGVGALLVLQQAADPLVVFLVAGALAVLLVLPVGGDAVLGHLVHLPGADLHLEGDAVLAHHRGVQTLVHIGLGGADIVLEPAQDGVVEIVDDAQHVVAVGHRVHDHPEGDQVKDVVELLVLGVHLAVDAVGVLQPPADDALDAGGGEPAGDLLLDGGHEAVVLGGLVLQGPGDLPVAHGIQVLEAQVLQLPLHLLHAQPVGDGGVDLHGLVGLLLLLLRGLILHGAHVVEPVGDLDEDDPDILGHGHEHLAQVLHLLLRLGGVLDAGQLADALHQIGDGGRELAGDILMGGGGVLDGVVEQGRGDGLAVQMQLLGQDLGHRQRVGHEGGAVLPELSGVGGLGKVKGGPDLGKVGARVVGAYGILQMLILLFQCHTGSPPLCGRSEMFRSRCK